MALLAALGLAGVAVVFLSRTEARPVPSFQQQACGVPPEYVERTLDGYYPLRSGQIQLIPRYPAYFASGAGGWTHSGPWPYLQDVPLVFYGPGIVPATGEVSRPVTLADIAPTIATLVGDTFQTKDGESLGEVTASAPATPKLVVTVVWDGGGFNTLDQWPDAWPNLARMMEGGVSYPNATVGSSPSVTPSVHATIGTGVFPARHGITDIPVLDDDGRSVDAFQLGKSSRFMEVPTFAEHWDEAHDNRALIGMIGYEPWHLGMIGQGAERAGGDKDDAVWLDIETNEWISNGDHYRLPDAVVETGGLESDVNALDAADGEIDGAWGEHEILDERDRLEETPAFITYHGRVMRTLIQREGYGRDSIADLLFTNFKQIDRVGHYFNMASDEVHDSVVETDKELGLLAEFLDEEIGRGNYVIIVTADHGQQPDEGAIGGYGINPQELTNDIEARFGPVVQTVRPTQILLHADKMERNEVSLAEVSRFVADYRVEDNADDPSVLFAGSGRFDRDDRLFDMVVPSDVLASISCGLESAP